MLIHIYRKTDLYVFELFDGTGEKDLMNRIIKAFQTLAEYNNAEKPKEAF